MKLLSKLSSIRPLNLLPILIFVQFFQTLDACCGGGCGCGCSYGCYQPQQQTVQVQQQPIYIPYPVPVNNNNNNGAAARSYRNYVNGVGTGNNNNNNNGNSNNNRPTNTNNANTDQAQTNALLASLVTQLQRSNALNSANTNNNNNNGNAAASGSGGTSYSNNNAMKALQEAANQQQKQANSNTVNNANNNNQNALLALLAQLQQLQQPPPPTTVKTTTTTTTTTTTQKPFSFDLGAALQSLLSHLPVPPPPTTTTTTTTPAPTTPKPILLSAEQVDQLRNILAAIGGSAAQQNDQAQRAHVAPKGLAALIAQDANGGGAVPPPPSDSDDDEYDEDDDVVDEEFDHPPGYGRAHPMTSRLMTMLHMADALDQVTAISAPEIAHARPISSRIVGMINPDAANVTSDSDPVANGPSSSSPLGPVSRPLINMNIPIPPSERDPSIIRGNIFAWENGALSVGDMGIFDGRFIKADIGGFEKLNPAPEESGDDEEGELDEDQLHGVLMDFYYKFDTYDARDSIEHADLGDEAFAEIQKETESVEKEK